MQINRSRQIEYINDRLRSFSMAISSDNRLNRTDINLDAEDFFCELLNIIKGWRLKNLNSKNAFYKGVDLVDNSNKIIIQVTANKTKNKIETSLLKISEEHKEYNFKVLFLVMDDVSLLKKTSYNVPSWIEFDPYTDILTIMDIIRMLTALDSKTLDEAYQYVYKQLECELDLTKMFSDLTALINILSERESISTTPIGSLYFPLLEEKIEYNNLIGVKRNIKENSQYFSILNDIYKEFELQGVDKKRPIFNKMRRFYAINIEKALDGSSLYYSIIDDIRKTVIASSNFDSSMSLEILDLYIEILVVDAFTRCELFEKPENGGSL